MGISVKFYSLSKKLNSTRQPSGTALAELTCVLKDGTGVVSPAIEVNTSSNPSSWNYCYISDFSRYYYVNEWTYYRGLWTASLSVDALASYKNVIGGSSQYIARSYSKYDLDVIDTGYATKSNVLTYQKQFGQTTHKLYHDYTSGTYVVAIINTQSGDTPGGISHYAMSYSQLVSLRQVLLGDADYLGNTGENVALLKTQVNPIQYITGIKYFPIDINHFTGTLISNIPLGWWTPMGISGKRLDGSMPTLGGIEQELDVHPDAARGNYLKYAPYTRYKLIYGPWGAIDLPMELLAGRKIIELEVWVDPFTGMASLYVTAGSSIGTMDRTIGNYVTPFGVDIPVTSLAFSNSSFNPGLDYSTNMWSKITGSIPIFGGLVAEGIGAIYSGFKESSRKGNIAGIKKYTDENGVEQTVVNRGIESQRRTDNYVGVTYGENSIVCNSSGSMGSVVTNQFFGTPTVFETFLRLVPENREVFGRPYCQNAQINTMSGYIKCADARLNLAASPSEANEVIAYMNGGFYYE